MYTCTILELRRLYRILGFRKKLRLLGGRQSIIPPRRKSTSDVGHSSETLKMVAWGKSAQI